jgi:hypothetical protein
MKANRFKGALRDMWWIVGLAVAAAPIVWMFAEPWIACFMPPFAAVTILYFAVFRYDDAGRERGEL